MPRGKGKTYKYYDAHDEVYPFYAATESLAMRYALDWSRRMGITLYRKRSK